MVRVGGHKAAVSGRIWHIAVLAAAGAIGTASHAEAALYYWFDPGYSRLGPPTVPHRRQKPRHHQAKKIEEPEKETAKPHGPLIIAISIEKQNVKIYDANGFFAEAPVSTGMKGHPTPMGVFSVIQKHKLHHSNIYSGAPMPYMQRITWSGVAMHAGVLPGYPASHGCIRMPMAFAMKMWNWTRMGARVVVTPGEMTPASFSHPLLVTQKVVPQPAAEPQADAPPAPKVRQGDRGRHADQARDFGGEPGTAVDRGTRRRRKAGHHRSVGLHALARTDPHRGRQRRYAGGEARGHDDRRDVIRQQGAAARGAPGQRRAADRRGCRFGSRCVEARCKTRSGETRSRKIGSRKIGSRTGRRKARRDGRVR